MTTPDAADGHQRGGVEPDGPLAEDRRDEDPADLAVRAQRDGQVVDLPCGVSTRPRSVSRRLPHRSTSAASS
jgi:hypothetical protein